MAALALALTGEAAAATYWVRPPGGSLLTADGLSYETAWRGLASIRWERLQPSDTLYVCGTFSGPTERLLLPAGPNGPDGTTQAPIVIDGSCRGGPGFGRSARIEAPPQPPSYGIETRRRDHFTIRNLELVGYSVLVLDSKHTVFEDVVVRDAPLTHGVYGAIDDRGLATRYERVRILNAGGAGIAQAGRAHNAVWTPAAGSTLWPLANSFLTKEDFQRFPTSTVIRDSVIDTVGRSEDYTGYHAVDLYWNRTVVVEGSTILDPGGSGIRIHTNDAQLSYHIDTAGTETCGPTCRAKAGYGCVEPDLCTNPRVDRFDRIDAYAKGRRDIQPSVTIRDNTIRAHFQEGPRPQCAYPAASATCTADSDCVFGFSCSGGACTRPPPPQEPQCGDQHYGIVVPGGAPFEGTLLIEGNTISGFAGNGILVETLWERSPAAPDVPTITIRGNDISGSGHWGIWLGHPRHSYPSGAVLVEGNRIHDNGTPHYEWAHGGVQLNGAVRNVTLRDNFIYRNGETSSDFDYYSKHGGLVIALAKFDRCLPPPAPCPCPCGIGHTPRDIDVIHNTFVDNNTANVMTNYYLGPPPVSTFASGLRFERNLSLFSEQFATATGRRGVHAAWRLPPPNGTAPPDPEWATLEDNLYYNQTGVELEPAIDPRVFSIEHQAFSSLADYLAALPGLEGRSLELDPQLDRSLLPRNPRAQGFGAR